MAFVSQIKRLIYESRLRRRYPDSVIHRGATVNGLSQLGADSVLFKNTQLSDTTLGPCSYLQENSRSYFAQIGPFCSIGPNVTIGLVNHPTSMVSTSPVFYDNTQPLPRFFSKQGKLSTETVPCTVIGADVWIGEGARIKAGVIVSVGAVIGAGALVTRDVDPYAIVGGIPAKVLRYRFNEDIRYRLVNSRWWELSEQELQVLAPYFSDPNAFLSAIETNR